jgi:hypothetical protein
MRAWFSRSDFTSTMISSFSFLYLVGDVLLLQPPQFLVVVGDLVEGLHHLRLQLGFDGRKRHLVFELVVVHVGFGRGLGRILFLQLRLGRGAERRRRRRRCRGRDMGGRGGLDVTAVGDGHRRGVAIAVAVTISLGLGRLGLRA